MYSRASIDIQGFRKRPVFIKHQAKINTLIHLIPLIVSHKKKLSFCHSTLCCGKTSDDLSLKINQTLVVALLCCLHCANLKGWFIFKVIRF